MGRRDIFTISEEPFDDDDERVAAADADEPVDRAPGPEPAPVAEAPARGPRRSGEASPRRGRRRGGLRPDVRALVPVALLLAVGALAATVIGSSGDEPRVRMPESVAAAPPEEVRTETREQRPARERSVPRPRPAARPERRSRRREARQRPRRRTEAPVRSAPAPAPVLVPRAREFVPYRAPAASAGGAAQEFGFER